MKPDSNDVKALLHRQYAIKNLARMMNESAMVCAASQNEIISTCIVLRFQTYFLGNGFVEFLTLLRLTNSLTCNYQQQSEQPGRKINDEGSVVGSTLFETSGPNTIDKAIFQSAIASLELIAPAAQNDDGFHLFHYGLLECCLSLLDSIPNGLKRFQELYFYILYMPKSHFEHVFHSTCPTARTLAAHYICLLLIVTALWATDSRTASIGNVSVWIYNLCCEPTLPPCRDAEVRWPMAVALGIRDMIKGDVGQDLPMSGMTLLKFMRQNPTAFTI